MSRRTNAERSDHKAKIDEFRRRGWSYEKIAERLGLSETTVRRDADPRITTTSSSARATATGGSIRRGDIRSLTAAKGRVTHTRENKALGVFNAPVPPANENGMYRLFNLVEDWRNLKDPASVMTMLARFSPEIYAAWNTLELMTVGGWEVRALIPGTDNIHKEANPILQDRLNRIGDRHGSLHSLFADFVAAACFRGGMCGEVILGPNHEIVDVVSVDPSTVRFRPVDDPIYGQDWELGQKDRDQPNGWLSLDIPTVKYLALRKPNTTEAPYGTPLFGAAIMPAVMLLSMMYDIKRVLEKQGFGRLDVTIYPDKIAEKMGSDADDDDKYQAVVDYFGLVSEVLETLEPDEVFVHTDDAEVKRAPNSGGEGGILAGCDRIIIVLERMVTKGLGSQPMLQAITDGVSEANANKQWEIYAKGISNLQQQIENLFSYLMETGLQAEGYLCVVETRFTPVRVIDEYREAETAVQRMAAAMQAEDRLYLTPDQAAEYVWDHPVPKVYQPIIKARLKQQLEQATNPPPPPTPAPNPEAIPASERFFARIMQTIKGEQRALFTPEGADDGFPGIENGVTDEDIDDAVRWFDEHVPLGAGVLDADPLDDEA